MVKEKIKIGSMVKVIVTSPYPGKVGELLEVDLSREFDHRVDVGNGWSCWFKFEDLIRQRM